MLKIGVIGLGNIAQKAYLPIISQMSGVEFHLFTRNQTTLTEIGQKYRFSHLYQSIDKLIESGIGGAFVHTATTSHEEIIEKLLLNNIHVYVDKPITNDYPSAKRLIALAHERNLLLVAGFNRRYAPAYQSLREESIPNIVVVEKNRTDDPKETRFVVFDDFIHVIDTTRYLFPYKMKQMIVHGKIKEGLLYHVVVQFLAAEGTAIAMMNRDSGAIEEKVEVTSCVDKRTVYHITETVIQKGGTAVSLKGGDWEKTLYKRGFEGIVTDFIKAIGGNHKPMIDMDDTLESHRICELIVQELEKSDEKKVILLG